MNTVVLFNNKGGVGKTTVAYHLAWMFRALGVRVLAVDLDPQSNLTTAFLDEDRLMELWPDEDDHELTIQGAIRPLLERLGDIGDPHVEEIKAGLWLLPGDLGLTAFEDRQAAAWPACLSDNAADAADAFRVISAYWRLMKRGADRVNADIVLIDVGPNLGAINRAALVATNRVVVPLAADLFSLQGLRNLGPTLREWRQGWKTRLAGRVPKNLPLPPGEMEPIGYVVLQHAKRQDRPALHYQRWMDRIPEEYRVRVLGRPPNGLTLPTTERRHQLGELKHYRSLMPMSQEARKPMFSLTPADGAIGSHVQAVHACFDDFERLARQIAAKCGLSLPEQD